MIHHSAPEILNLLTFISGT